MDLISLGLSKKYTEDTAIGLGAVKGAPATIEKIEAVEGGNNVTFLWTGTDGTQQRQTLFVANGQKGEAGPQGPRGEKGEKGEPGEGGGGSSAIIDVVELPTENINEQAFYRVLKAQFVFNDTVIYDYQCYCVTSLPGVGEVVTDAGMNFLIGYYSIANNEVYGYVDEALGSGLGVPAGWYPFPMLASASGVSWGEVITDIEDIALGDTLYLLLSYDYYTYKDEWIKMVFATEKSPKFDIKWDGVIGDRVALDLSQLGAPSGLYFVKVSDNVPSEGNIVGGSYFVIDSDAGSGLHMISEYSIDIEQIPGADVIDSYIIIVYDSDALSAALGISAGIYTNGVYFWYYEGVGYVKNFTSAPRIAPIDSMYLPRSVQWVANIYEADGFVTSHELHDYVDNAIGSAIGGSY